MRRTARPRASTDHYTAVNFIGLLDEFAIYDRPLSTDEIALLAKTPALLAPLRRN